MNFYEILNLKTNATLQEIKSQYRKLCLQFHPDKNNSPEATEKFKMINRAYETLSNEKERREYDYSLLGKREYRREFTDPMEFFRSHFQGFEDMFQPTAYGRNHMFGHSFGSSMYGNDDIFSRNGFGKGEKDIFSDLWNGFESSSFHFSSNNPKGYYSKSTSTSIRNGVKVTETRIIENGTTRIEVETIGRDGKVTKSISNQERRIQ